MIKKKINIVWLKRDLRLRDNLPFSKAEKSNITYLAIYIMDPEMIEYKDTSLRHLQFVYHSILELNKEAKTFHQKVHLCFGDTRTIFYSIAQLFEIKNVFSYQESGTEHTWNRDKLAKKLFNQLNIQWTEFQRDGVIRGIRNRTGWDINWNTFIN